MLRAAEVPVRLERLNQAGRRVSEADAQLVELDENYARISLVETASSARLHWGTPVRFELEDAKKRYEMTGVIVARRPMPVSGDADAGRSGEGPILTWELRIRIWDCTLNVQRRLVLRRKMGFPVLLYKVEGTEAQGTAPVEMPEPIIARCVDIGAGGMRVRIPKLNAMPARMRQEFCMALPREESGQERLHHFCLAGRVIRALPQGRHADNLDVAFCFEGLTVRDGLALHNLLK